MVKKPKRKINKYYISIAVTICLAFTGYLWTSFHDRNKAQYKANLERVNEQLQNLYGPLYILAEAEHRSFEQFLSKLRPYNGALEGTYAPTLQEEESWRLWIKEVTMPNYLAMERTILEHSDLFVEDEIPEPILKLSAHIAGYKKVVAGWTAGDFSKHTSFFKFPQEVREYAKKRYKQLKKKQSDLVGLVEGDTKDSSADAK